LAVPHSRDFFGGASDETCPKIMKYENAKKQTEKLQNQCEKNNDAMLFCYFSHE
jgi:hypothetical protein